MPTLRTSAPPRERPRQLAEEAERVPVQAVRQPHRPGREPPHLLELDAPAVESPDERTAALGAEVEGDVTRRRSRRGLVGLGAARRRRNSRPRRAKSDAFGISTLSSSSVPVTTPIARCSKLVRKSAFWRPAKTRDREHDADDRPAAAEDRDPAEQHDRDDAQLEPEAVVLHGSREAEGVEDARERADEARHHEEDQLRPLDTDPGEPRGLLVRAHHEQRPPDRRGVQDDPEDDRKHDEDPDRVRQVAAGVRAAV